MGIQGRYIYRENAEKRIVDFQERLQKAFPNAKLFNKPPKEGDALDELDAQRK